MRHTNYRRSGELHPHPGAGELLDQQRLAGELAGQPVRGIAQHHIDAALGGQVTQRLQGRADQRRPGMTLVLEHPLLGQVSPQRRACSRSAAVCDPIVSSFFCRALETRA